MCELTDYECACVNLHGGFCKCKQELLIIYSVWMVCWSYPGLLFVVHVVEVVWTHYVEEVLPCGLHF